MGARTVAMIVLFLAELSRAPAQQADPLGEAVANYWTKLPKLYLVITAASPTSHRFQPIAWVDKDGTAFAAVLNGLGYKPLPLPSPLKNPLQGESVNSDNVPDALKAINSLPANSIVIVYFSGHGEPGAQGADWQMVLNDGNQVPFTQLYRLARGGHQGSAAYQGQLVFLIDACNSGTALSSDLRESELRQFATDILTSSGSTELSRKLKNSDESAFTHVVRLGATTNWADVDENQDGFLDYSELERWSEVELSRLFTQKEVDAKMHPLSMTDLPDFLAYDKSKDQRPHSVRRRRLIAEGAISDLLHDSALQVSYRGGTLQPPRVPTEAKRLASLISESTDLPPLSQGYMALAEGKSKDAERFFSEVVKVDSVPADRSAAEVALARTELFSGNFQGSLDHYRRANLISPSPETSEMAIGTLLAGGPIKSMDIATDELARNFFEALKKPDKVTFLDPAFAMLSSTLLVAYTKQNDSKGASAVFKKGKAASDQLEKSDSPDSRRAAALFYANAGELFAQKGDDMQAAKYFRKSEGIYSVLSEPNPAYSTMLLNYGDLLQKQNKDDQAEQKRKLANSLKTLNFDSVN